MQLLKHVLIVENGAMIRFDLSERFEAAGFVVDQASGAEQALSSLRQNRSIRVVVSNVDIPGSIDGLRLLKLIQRQWPAVIRVVCTAYDRASLHTPPEIIRLSKPIDSNRWEAALRAINDQLNASFVR